jgi:hypothetical protein
VWPLAQALFGQMRPVEPSSPLKALRQSATRRYPAAIELLLKKERSAHILCRLVSDFVENEGENGDAQPC